MQYTIKNDPRSFIRSLSYAECSYAIGGKQSAQLYRAVSVYHTVTRDSVVIDLGTIQVQSEIIKVYRLTLGKQQTLWSMFSKGTISKEIKKLKSSHQALTISAQLELLESFALPPLRITQEDHNAGMAAYNGFDIYPRDTGRKKVYNAERFFINNSDSFDSLESAQTYADKLYTQFRKEYYFHQDQIIIQFGSRSWARIKTATINLGTYNVGLLFHEFVHLIIPRHWQSHGIEYVTEYLHIVHEILGEETYQQLKNSFDNHKVSYNEVIQ